MGNNKNTPNVKLNHLDRPQEVGCSKEITPSFPHLFELHLGQQENYRFSSNKLDGSNQFR